MNTFVMQQEKVHFQALAQGDERKEKMSQHLLMKSHSDYISQELLKLLQ